MRAQLATLAALSVIGACRPAEPPLTREAVATYLARVGQWAPEEAEVGRAVRRILETQLVDEAEVRRQLAEARPRIARQLERMRAFAPPRGALETIHGEYRAAWEGLAAACGNLEHGLDTGEQQLLGRGRQGLIAWREELASIAQQLRSVAAPEPEMERGPPS